MNDFEAQNFEFGGFRLDTSKRLLTDKSGENVPLTPKVFDLLLYLVQNNGKLVEKDELMAKIWTDTIVEENNLSQNISILRRILGEKRGEHRFIATIPGHGYKFVAEVTAIEQKKKIPEKVEKTSFAAAELETLISHPNDESEFTQDQETETENHSSDEFHNAPRRIKKSFWLIGATVFAVSVLVLFGFYLRRENVKSAVAAPIKTIAVLPFKPLVAENRDEVLEIGMADTLIARLGNNREIIVRPLSSVRKFGNLEQDALQAGRDLDVESVLDGSIQRWADKIRVNVRLIRTTDGSSLWTGTFDEKFTDIFVVQDAISTRVAAALSLQLSGDEQAQLEKHSTNNAKAYEFYLRGRYHAQKVTAPELRKSINLYDQAITLDPNFALALAGKADAYRTLAVAAFEPSKEVCPQAKQFARQSLEIDPTLAEARIVLGWVGFLCEWDWETAETELKKSIELTPNNSEAYRGYAHFLSNRGRHDEAVEMGRRARELAPLTLITATLEGQFLSYAGRDAEAIEQLGKTLELDPDFWVAHNVLGRVYTRQERYAEAVAELQKARDLSGGSTEPLMQLGYALAKAGRRDEAAATLAELKKLAAEKYVPAYNFAMIYNGLDEKQEALSYLERSFAEREAQLSFVKIDTRWNWLRNEPRFVEIIKRMNLE